MSLFDFLKKKSESETPTHPRNKAAEHNARARSSRVSPETPASSKPDPQSAPQPFSLLGNSFEVQPEPGQTNLPKRNARRKHASDSNPLAKKFQSIMDAAKKIAPSKMPNKYLVRTAVWDLSSWISLFVNAVLLGLVLLLAFKVNSLQNTINDLLGGLYDNFVRMDKSYISTTITMEDVPIPINFNLPVVQDQTNVTLTQDVIIRKAYVVIDTGLLDINAPATVTLPAGTTLPVSLRMDVPVQTTVLVDLQVPVNIELASAHSSDPAIANLHTAFLGLQDTIGPLYCLMEPLAVDYLFQPLCTEKGIYIDRAPTSP